MSDFRIQDDLYEYVNHDWLESAVIPSDRPMTGGFALLDLEVEELLTKELKEMIKENKYPNKHLENACKLFSLITDVKKRNRDGIKPAIKKLNVIYKLKNVAQLNRNYKELLLSGYALPFDLNVIPNMKDTDSNALYLSGPRTILPDSSYYKPGMEQQKEMMFQLWTGMAQGILAQTKLTEEEQKLFLEDTLKFDSIIGSLVKTSEEQSEYTKMYNPMPFRRVATLLKPIKFKKLILDLYGEELDTVIVTDVRFLKGFKELFNEENFEAFKHWSYVTKLIEISELLSEPLRELGGSFMRALTGVAEMPNVDKYAFNLVSMMYSEPIGIYYGEKYFGPEAKKDVTEMVYEIINKYKERIKNNDILAEETKAKAIIKLDKMTVNMGYPEKVRPLYSKLEFDNTDNLLNVMASLNRIMKEEELGKLHKPVDKEEWGMPGHMVNASYNPFNNNITFPAAILQAPFYSIKQTRSQNLGGIGAVIGHEISHAFDNNGSKCDEKGNINNWWTKEDFKKFEKKTKAMIKEFEGIVLPWGPVNSNLIVSENIADNGGMAVTLDIMSHSKDSNFEEYFENWGRIWRMKAHEGFLQLLLQMDVHAPTVLRANMPPRNFDEWYNTYNVTKKDKMYLAPNKRVVIW